MNDPLRARVLRLLESGEKYRCPTCGHPPESVKPLRPHHRPNCERAAVLKELRRES